MARKKRTPTDITEPEPPGRVGSESEPATTPPAGESSAESHQTTTPLPNAEAVSTGPQKQWGDPYKAIFSSSAKGFEMGENRRFKQRVFLFKEKPDPSVVDRLKEQGFTYRPEEKAWTVPANPATRKLTDEMARELAGPTAAMRRE